MSRPVGRPVAAGFAWGAMSRLRRAARGRRVLGLARDPTSNGGHGPPYERRTVGEARCRGSVGRPVAAGLGWGAMSWPVGRPVAAGLGFGA
jgi:hypothetical protein